ncbi:MAG: hypothetical protein ABSF23_04410 [Terracidiphilus sp.]|jgi:hypothetical protein
MFYDARVSMGMLFTLIGTVLMAFGLATRGHAEIYAASLGVDANLWWGLVLLAFGIVVMTLGRRGQARLDRAAGGGNEPVRRKALPKKTRSR